MSQEIGSVIEPSSAAAPCISVVVPLFNKAAHFSRTLASIDAQTFRDFEIIVVDDGSTDGSIALVQNAEIEGLRLIAQANAGPGAARNRGIAEARGEWIAFLDADDLWRPDHLATIAATIDSLPTVDVIATGFVRSSRPVATSASAIPLVPQRAFRANFFACHDKVWTSATAVRTSVLRRIGGFGPTWPGEDVELWTRLALNHTLALHPHVTATYVQETGGAMDSGAGAPPTSTTIEQQPVMRTIACALSDPRHVGKAGALRRYRNALLIAYARPALFNGHAQIARSYFALARSYGAQPPLHLSWLSRLPPFVLRPAIGAYALLKRRYRMVRRRVTG